MKHNCNLINRTFGIIMVLCMILTIVLQVPQKVLADEEKTLSDDIIILYTNDIHTYIDGDLSYDVIAAIKKDLEKEYKYVFLADAGDHIQGTAYGSMDKGETIVKLMNAAKYDVATLGNHEFDYGMFNCMKAIDEAEFSYISSNFYHEENGIRMKNVLDSYVMFECGSEKVAFVGITTPETFSKSTPSYFQDNNGNYIYGISGGDNGEKLYEDVQRAINEAKASGATKIIALGHLGDGVDSKPWTSEETISNVSGLDAFIDGHSHSIVKGKNIQDKTGKEVLLTQTGEYFNRIGIMKIESQTSEIITDFIECQEILDGDGNNILGYKLASEIYTNNEVIIDDNVKTIKEGWIADIDSKLSTEIGLATVILDNYDAEGKRLVRVQETNSGDFCADALYYLFDNMDMDVDFAIMNGGGIRNKAVTGSMSYKTCKEIHTFGNVACLQTITGQQLLDALEWGARFVGEAENGGFLHVSGITYKINTSIPDTTKKDEKGIWVAGPEKYRVYDVKIYNKKTNTWDELKLDEKYNLAGYNYTLRDLGDGFNMFEGAINVLDYVMEDYMVLSNYVCAFENGSVGATNSPITKKYSNFIVDYTSVNGSGRIKVNEKSDDKIIIGGLDNNVWFSKYGNVYLSCETSDFLGNMNFAIGDMVTVKFLNQEITLPVVPDYTYVDSGSAAIIAHLSETGEPTGNLALAVNMGNFGEYYGLATKKTNDNGDWWWEAKEGVSFPIEVTFKMYEQGGYSNEILLRELTYTNKREDYMHLSDEEFANFREINTTGISIGKLYRTSSPINPEMNRNVYALEALKKAGVTVIINLADNAESTNLYEGFNDTYYAKQKVIYLNLGVDFAGEEFKTGLAKGLKYISENEGIYAIHCTHGKDRAGFVSALLECLMGANYDEVIGDYMVTYYNYYGVQPGTDKYKIIAEDNIVATLEKAFGVENLKEADLEKEAYEYIHSLGLNDNEIANLKDNLSDIDASNNNPNTGDNSNMVVYLLVALLSAMALKEMFENGRKKLR